MKNQELNDRIREEFTQVYNVVLEDKRLDVYSLIVYIALCSRAWTIKGKRNDHVYPSLNEVRKQLGVSKDIVIRSMRILESLGYIEVERSKGERRNNYVITEAVAENNDKISAWKQAIEDASNEVRNGKRMVYPKRCRPAIPSSGSGRQVSSPEASSQVVQDVGQDDQGSRPGRQTSRPKNDKVLSALDLQALNRQTIQTNFQTNEQTQKIRDIVETKRVPAENAGATHSAKRLESGARAAQGASGHLHSDSQSKDREAAVLAQIAKEEADRKAFRENDRSWDFPE